MFVQITGFYSGLLAFFSIALSANVIRLRLRDRVSLGHGNSKDLLRAMRAHGNFFEYIPIAVVMMGIAEVNGLSASYLHLIGFALFIARIFHAISIYKQVFSFRQVGTGATFTVILALAVTNMCSYIFG